jgi:hypothetical protein
MNLVSQWLENFDPNGKMPIELPMDRRGLAVLFSELGFKSGAEIGIERGEYSEVLLRSNPGLHLIMVDPWRPYKGYREHVTAEKLHGFMLKAIERTSQYNRWVIRESSMDALNYVPDSSLDFVYIDANHDFLNTTQDIHHWERKVRPGGIVSGHDFTRRKNKDYANHVKDVVQAWTYSHGIRPWFVCRGDHSPSWFWVKQ